MLTAIQNPKIVPKLRLLVNLENWQSGNARNIYFKLVQQKPILTEELEVLGKSTINPSTIDNAVAELIDYDYFNKIESWLNNISVAKDTSDRDLLHKLLDNRPLKVGVSRYMHVTESADALMRQAADAKNPSGTMVRMPFVEVRNVLGDLAPGSMHIIAGPPGSLKSGFSEQFDLYVTKQFKGAIYSLEMVSTAKMARYAQHLYGAVCGPLAVQTGNADVRLLEKAKNELANRKLFIESEPDNITQLIDSMELIYHEQHPDYYSIDFLQVLNPLHGETDYQAVKNSIKQIYSFAKRYQVPVLLLSQLNREAVKDQFTWKGDKIDRTPKMSDLEGAGTIEQLAHSVTFIHPVDGNPNVRRMYVAKNRNGQSPYDFGEVQVVPEEMNMRFTILPQYLK